MSSRSLFGVSRFFGLVMILSSAGVDCRAEEDAWGRESGTPAPKVKAEIKKKKAASRAPASYKPNTIYQQTEKKLHPEKPVPKLVPETSLPSDKTPNDEEGSYGLTGGWGGVRKKIENQGLNLSVVYKGDFVRNLSGGIEQKNMYLDNLDVKLLVDAEKLFGAKGLSIFAYGLGNSGTKRGHSPTLAVGDVQGTHNIQANNDDFKLYELWAQYLSEDDHFSVLFGLHDLNSEFYVTDSSTVLIHSSFGAGFELAQSGSAGPSIFPHTAPALRFRYEPSKRVYAESGIFNGPSEMVLTENGTHLGIHPQDGFLLINEAGLLGDESNPYKLGLGYWSYTKTFADHVSGSPTASYGAYVLGDKSFTSHLSAFVRYGIASPECHDVKDNLSLGAVYKGLIPGRDDDRLALGIAHVTPTDSSFKAEDAFELTYRAEVMHGVAIQPDFQYVTRPGMSGTVPNAFVSGLRVELSL